MKNIKSQMWFMDFVIGTFIFLLVLIFYYNYTSNTTAKEFASVEDLVADSESISSSILAEGFPSDWDNTTVQNIGITDNNQAITSSKVINFKKLDYDITRKLFGTPYDYVIFFQNDSNTTLNVEGACAIGNPAVNSTYKVKAAYYYKDEDDAYLKDFMTNEMNADIYCDDGCPDDFDDLENILDNYNFLVIEHPAFSSSEFEDYEDDIEDFVSDGNTLMLSGEMSTAQGKEMVNVEFRKKSGQSISDRNSTVVYEDPYLDFEIGENIIFAQAYYVERDGASNFIEIAEFNSDDRDAIARWTYGSGKVFYFSDFDVGFFNGNFVEDVQSAATSWGNFPCNPISMGSIKYSNFLKTERFLLHNGKTVKMVLYLWQ